MPGVIKISLSSAWLLRQFAERHPGGIRNMVAMPVSPKGVSQPHMPQVRGLQRRGWLREACTVVPRCLGECTGHSGIFFITGKGLDAAAALGFIRKFKDP